MIDARDVSLSYGQVKALDAISLTVARQEVVALVGASGSGKSSLLYCLAGLLAPTRGEVVVDDQRLSTLSTEQLAALRRTRMGFVFQFAQLVPELSLRDNIALPLELAGRPRAEVRARVGDLVARLGLAERADARPHQVSGGQAQRAAVARAIAHQPAVLFADEPTGALDTHNGEAVLELMLELARENGASVVLVTHDRSVAARADRLFELRDGRQRSTALDAEDGRTASR